MPAAGAPHTRPVGSVALRDRRAWTTHAVVTALLVAYVAALYLAAVLAGRFFLGVSTGAGPALTVLVAAVAALGSSRSAGGCDGVCPCCLRTG